MACDMICSLMNLPECKPAEGIKIKRVFPADKGKVQAFIREHFSENWACEAEYAMMQEPVKCFVATENSKILGFSCYDASAKGFFGPIGVAPEARGKDVGTALLLRTLNAMKEFGYGYAIIGWVGDAEVFYRKTVNAEFIKGGEPENSVYADMVDM